MAEPLDLREERQRARHEEFTRTVLELLAPDGDELAVDVGSGLGAFAFALAPHVARVIGVDSDAPSVGRAREVAQSQGVTNVEFRVGDARALNLADYTFDIAGCVRTLHHVDRPELVISELTRVTRPGGWILVVDQIGPSDPLEALEIDRFEQARDPSHTRALPDGDLRQLFEANGLDLVRTKTVHESRELEPYLDLAGCSGAERERARALARGGQAPDIFVGWYLLRR
jgi:ubiquinone/menaquinone biosynthesis C-methylase UbiE